MESGIYGREKEGRSRCVSCMAEIEDIYHVMYECVNFNQERLKYLHKYLTNLSINRDKYIITMFKNAREEDYKNICNFWVAVEKIKSTQ